MLFSSTPAFVKNVTFVVTTSAIQADSYSEGVFPTEFLTTFLTNDKLQDINTGNHLEHRQQGLGEVIERASFGHSLVKIELSPEKLHAQQGKYDDEEEEQQQQRGDGLHGIQQGGHQVAERSPVSVEGNNKSCDLVTKKEHRSTGVESGLIQAEGGRQSDRSPRDFEDAQETYAAEDRDAKRGHDGELHQDGLHDPAAYHETVKAVKQGHKVGLQPQAVHLHEHLQGEHRQENFVGNLCGEAERQNLSNVGPPRGSGYEFCELVDQSRTHPELRSASLAGCSARRQW